MKFLFCSEAYPGPLGALAAYAAAKKDAETVFATGRQRLDIPLPNVQRVVLKKKRPVPDEDRYDLAWCEGLRTGQYALHTFKALASFDPDIIFVAAQSGIAFFLRQAFPSSFIVGYALAPAPGLGANVAAAHMAMQAQQLLYSDLAFAWSEDILAQMPPAIAARMALIPLSVDTDFFSPKAAAPWHCWKFATRPQKLLVINLTNASNDEASASMRLGLELAGADDHLHIVCIIPARAQLEGALAFVEKLSPDVGGRIFVSGSMEPHDLRNLLAAASLVVFPSAVGAVSMLEAMSCAAPIMAPDNAAPFLRPGQNMLPMPANPEQAIPAILADAQWLVATGAMARESVLVDFNKSMVIKPHFEEILRAWNHKREQCV